ncbi:cytochrome c oxidase accessory protein FixG [Humitalea rosea]|uniref:Cytochrome c oxidase accessory protein FixG n=1 Tax=Humitalea rosea TaxID=990373 RepID=A0A2W7K6B4_9PROT|nr:cytochrome c oxidase accessory protein CcoG [Humitalea rosea]PZW43050.1 cytochrome c oxidase accessory protein FixG [Humitalea rosea]
MPDTTSPAAPSSLYAPHRKVYPRAVKGRVRSIKWIVLAVLLGLYYIVPWLRWDRGPGVPNQAVLADISNARLFFFWIELWPQEIYFLTGFLILAAIGLFAATSLFGRVWCGFTCPQTVWTDLFMWVERRIEGDRNARMKRDAGPPSRDRTLRRIAKHAAWIVIAVATGGAWIMYFQDAPTLVRQLATGSASTETYFFVALFTATTYMLAGFAREQVCTYMCPWPRFQGAMLDQDSLVVTYREWRGEPRGKLKGAGHGDCVDCGACVHVCPTGIDIRDGQQLECIGCGLCIDACDEVMGKVNRPDGLISFETLANLAASTAATARFAPGPERQQAGMAARTRLHLIRPRTMMYAGVLAFVVAVMLAGFLLRDTLTLTALAERAPPFVRLSDGGIRNAYTLKLADKTRDAGHYVLTLQGPPGLQLLVQDVETDASGRPILPARPDGVATFRALVTAGPELPLREHAELRFRLLDAEGHVVASGKSVFLGPER